MPKTVTPTAGASSIRLSQETVRDIPLPTKEQGSRLVFDQEIPGFCVQVSYSGTKTFRLRYRKAGKWYSVKLGRWRDGTESRSPGKGGITAAQARARAGELRRDVDGGKNPARDAKLQEMAQMRTEAGAITVTAAWQLYMADVRNRRNPMKESSAAKANGVFLTHIEPVLGSRYMGSLIPEDAVQVANTATRRRQRKGRAVGGEIAANRAIAILSAFLTWASKSPRNYVETNIVRQIDRREVLAEETKRERYLTQPEWIAVMAALDEHPYLQTRGSRFGPTVTVRLEAPQLRQLVSCEALRVCLLTGARKGEVMPMRWANVDLERGWWRKPKETMKGGKAHEVALPEAAIASLRKLQGLDPVFVFPGKARLDSYTRTGKWPKGDTGGPVLDIHELWGRIRTKLGIPDVRIHDLRHTAASVLISSGATLHEVGEQLAHVNVQTTMRYAHLLEEAKRKTASRMDAYAESLKKPEPTG